MELWGTSNSRKGKKNKNGGVISTKINCNKKMAIRTDIAKTNTWNSKKCGHRTIIKQYIKDKEWETKKTKQWESILIASKIITRYIGNE